MNCCCCSPRPFSRPKAPRSARSSAAPSTLSCSAPPARAFSKAFGLAGARVGYAVSPPEVADALNRIRPAFNVSNVAQAGAAAALTDLPYVENAARIAAAARGRVCAERHRMAAALRAQGVPCAPSAANFLMVDVGPHAAHIYEQLLRGGVI